MKFLLSIFLLTLNSFLLLSQLNPIQNLYWDHDYQWPVEPFNTFLLSWDEPNESTGILKGYNIYAHNEIWRFQEYIGAECTSIITSDCNFFDFLNAPDWIKVKAVDTPKVIVYNYFLF